MLMLYMGKASKVTMGHATGFFTEASPPPVHRFDCFKGPSCDPLECPPHSCLTGPRVPDDPIPHDVDKVF